MSDNKPVDRNATDWNAVAAMSPTVRAMIKARHAAHAGQLHRRPLGCARHRGLPRGLGLGA
jgi:hypothetical protein